MVDPAVPNPVQQNNPVPVSEGIKVKISKRKIYITAAVIGVCLLVILAYFLLPQSVLQQLGIAGTNSSSSLTQPTNGKKPADAIAKVGNEYIYKKDLEAELANFPGAKEESMKKQLLKKLVKDSIILQAGAKENLISSQTMQSQHQNTQTHQENDISLPENIYNSPDKEYMKRIEAVKNVEKAVNSAIDQISGTMISVWFHNQIPAKIGVEKGKQEALKRITALHDRVAKKEITIEDAGKLIATDPSYADLDPGGYQNNAIIPFSYPKGKQITIDSGFDEILWDTKQGNITPVYLGKTQDFSSQKEIEAYYIFGDVKKKIDTGNTKDFDMWYETQKNKYEVTYY